MKFFRSRQSARKSRRSKGCGALRPSFQLLEPRLPLATLTWINPSGGSWDASGNWRDELGINRLPGAEDDVVIDVPGNITITRSSGNSHTIASLVSRETLSISAGTLTIAGDATLDAISLSGGTLSAAGTTSIASFTWSGGTLSGGGSTAIPVGGTLNLTGNSGMTLDAHRLSNQGTVNWTGSGIFYLVNSSAVLNEAGGSFNLASNSYLWNTTGTLSTFTNRGLLTKSGTGTSYVYSNLEFANSGTVDIQSGVLEFQTGGAAGAGAYSSGLFSMAAGTRVEISHGPVTLQSGAALTGPGSLRMRGGSLDLAISSLDVSKFELTGGEVRGSGNLRVVGNMNWTSGSISGGGTLEVTPGASLLLSTFSQKTLSRPLDNWGTIDWSGGIWYVQSGGSVRNRVGAQWNIPSDQYVWNSAATPAMVNNEGAVVRATGTGTTSFYGPIAFANSGVVDVRSGIVSFQPSSGYGLQNSGSITIGAGARVEVQSAMLNLQPGTNITGAGTLRLNGGELNVTATEVEVPVLELSSGRVRGPGNLKILSRMNWGSGSVEDSGQLLIGPGATLHLAAGGNQILKSRTLENEGTIQWSSSGTWYFQQGATLLNRATGVVNITADAYAWNDNGSAAIINQGVFKKTGGTTSTYLYRNGTSFTFDNQGVVEVRSGALDFGDALLNYSSGVLTGGEYLVSATMRINNAALHASSAKIVLDGVNSKITNQSNVDALAEFAHIQPGGALTLRGGRQLQARSTFTNQGALTIEEGSSLVANSGEYASSVIGFSTQYSTSSWSAQQALGPPDVFNYGDNSRAWAPGPANGTLEYLTLGFATPQLFDRRCSPRNLRQWLRLPNRFHRHRQCCPHHVVWCRSLTTGGAERFPGHLAAHQLPGEGSQDLRQHEPQSQRLGRNR